MRNKKEFKRFLIENKKAVDEAFEQMEIHSREFDRKVSKILASL